MGQFQSTINVYNPLGFVGGFAFQGPTRAVAVNVNSSGTPNLFGNAYTFTSAATADPASAAPNGGTVQVGGTGVFAGIMIEPKQNVLTGVTGNPLGATLALPDNSVAELLQMGYAFVNLPGPANPGDLLVYDPTTGNLNSIAPTTTFTASIAAGGSAGVNDVLTVSAVTAGNIYVGMPVIGVGVAGGTFISSFGTGKGYTGTYNLTSINEQTVSSEAMSGANAPLPAFSGAGYITTSLGVDTLHVTTATSGDVLIGMQVVGVGIAANTVITAFTGGAVGGTGTYTLNTSGQTVFSSGSPGTITGPTQILIAGSRVERYQANTLGGVAVIRLTQ